MRKWRDAVGFFESFGRLIAGKPAFQSEPSNEERSAQHTQGTSRRFVDERGYKIIPDIKLAHTASRIHSGDMTVTTWATNTSSEAVRIDNALVLGRKRNIQQELSPGQGREIKLYEGPVASDEHSSRAELTFRLLANGDLFEIVYFVEFDRQSDGTFIIEDLHPDSPTRDI